VIVFADSSALVAHYDPGEDDVLPSDQAVTASALARVEVVSALSRKIDDGAVDRILGGALIRQFQVDWHGGPSSAPRFRTVALGAKLLERAAGIVVDHRLRTLDAIQLASALVARSAEPECQTMVVLDERLRWAAAAEGFDLLPLR
jgi:uncharacterized protein